MSCYAGNWQPTMTLHSQTWEELAEYITPLPYYHRGMYSETFGGHTVEKNGGISEGRLFLPLEHAFKSFKSNKLLNFPNYDATHNRYFKSVHGRRPA
ncbi:hypothetical protein AVEN_28373-1 [Araneus ventricosus]|uniref:Uncharacterized protein n=1 Tax=Araneus ventricosus TaxID=182803 RepID=A0A4Y2NWS0_ARAVE|nr:hypothetical protein AVEN_28373-1 [Araneus ventricosus]